MSYPILSVDSNGLVWQLIVNPDGSITTSPAVGPTIIGVDSDGNACSIQINPDGSVTTTPASSGAIVGIVGVDVNGQAWRINVNPDGSLSTVPTSAAGTPTADFSQTLQDVVNLCMTHVDLMPLANVGGFNQEPALSLSNDTIQELLAQPYDWKFNSKSISFMATMPSRQDYLFGGASAFVIGIGGVSIGLSSANAIYQAAGSALATVKFMQPHNFSVGQTMYMVGNDNSAFNSTRVETTTQSGWTNGWAITAVIDNYTVQINTTVLTPNVLTSGAPGILDYSWLERATMYDTSSTDAAPYEWEVEAVKSLKRNGQFGRPRKMCVLSQQNGVLKIRLDFVPQSPIFAITPHYQKKAPIKTDLSQSWAPFPDEYGFVYRQMFLARCYRYLDKPRADSEYQKAQAMIAKALGHDDTESSDQFVSPENPLMGGGLW